MKKWGIFLSVCFFLISGCSQAQTPKTAGKNLNIAVEYTDHAAAFYFAEGKSLFKEAGF